ncbi:hypothetical protein [uncultured Marinobacter sp.]|uniref:hypothetical protein n=1 Tax=uncultured Marinobacter sp. TaxID=187379 RepID=UPI002588D169|nr:hypothetical protein [uncultured Marinobacter sp.]
MSDDNDDTPTEQSIRKRLLEAHRSGSLMEAVEETCRTAAIAEEGIAGELAALHNNGTIDIVEAFSELRKSEAGFIFFGVRAVFEHALPEIEHDVLPVIRCVRHLVHEAGDDLAAGTTISHFIMFLQQIPIRPKQALSSIKAEPELHDLLPATLIAGYKLDMPEYLKEALQLTKAEHADMRRQAVFALSRIEWSDENKPSEAVYAALEEILSADTSDEMLATTARTAASLIKYDPSQVDRLIDLLDSAVEKGGDQSIHASASLLAQVDKHMPEALIEKLLTHINRVNPEHKGTIDQIDYAMHRLIMLGKIDVAIYTLEVLIAEKVMEPDAFDSVLHDIQRDATLLNKAATRWLLNGNASLCRTAAFLVGGGHGANVAAEVDPSEIEMTDARGVVFLARKVCGYFFTDPVSAASMLLSLLQLAQDNQTRAQIGKLILNPLLINYPGKARTYFNERRESCTAEAQEVLRQIDVALDEYFQALRSIGDIPELYPSQAQRESYQRHHSREMDRSFKEAEKKSVFLGLVTKQTLLYGRTSVTYVRDGQGTSHRQEIPLQEHSMEFEFPRMVQLDPLGLEYQLAVFRAERWQE